MKNESWFPSASPGSRSGFCFDGPSPCPPVPDWCSSCASTSRPAGPLRLQRHHGAGRRDGAGALPGTLVPLPSLLYGPLLCFLALAPGRGGRLPFSLPLPGRPEHLPDAAAPPVRRAVAALPVRPRPGPAAGRGTDGRRHPAVRTVLLPPDTCGHLPPEPWGGLPLGWIGGNHA